MYDLATLTALNEAATLPSVTDVREYVTGEIDRLISEEPKDDFRHGYLAALLAVARGGLKEDLSAIPFHNGLRVLDGEAPFGTCSDGTAAWGPWSNFPRECHSR